jgi:hypothetical protein
MMLNQTLLGSGLIELFITLFFLGVMAFWLITGKQNLGKTIVYIINRIKYLIFPIVFN